MSRLVTKTIINQFSEIAGMTKYRRARNSQSCCIHRFKHLFVALSLAFSQFNWWIFDIGRKRLKIPVNS